MTGQSIGTVAGAAIGLAFGAPQIGAIAGGILGSWISPTVLQAPSIGDAKEQTSQAGAPIPKCFGHPPPIGVTLIDGDKLARKITTTESVGKGAPPKQKTDHWIATRAFLVCEGEISGFYRITRNGKLVYSTVPGDEFEDDSASFASQITIYTGTETQLPDPSLEAIHGVGNTHAYRGRSYFVVRDDEEIGGAMNRYMVEVAACGTVTTTDSNYALSLGPAFYFPGLIDLTGNLGNLGVGPGASAGDLGISFPVQAGADLNSTGALTGNLTTYTVLVKARVDDESVLSLVDRNIFGHWFNTTLGYSHWHIQLGGANNMTPEVVINHAAGAGTSLLAPFEVAQGQEFVFGFRRDGSAFELIFNGSVVASTTIAGLFDGSGKLMAGNTDAPASGGYVGSQGDAIGFDRALTNGELESLSLFFSNDAMGYVPAPDFAGLLVSYLQGKTNSDAAGGTSIAECSAVWKEIVAEIALRAHRQLPAALDIDIMTDDVPGFTLGNPGLSGTDYVRTLCMYYFVDLPEYDGMIHAIRRGGPVVATFTDDDLLDVEEEDDDTRGLALEGFKRVTVMYPDPANKYVATPQTSPRTSPDITASNTITLDCPIPFDAATMAQKADILQKIAFLQIEGGFKRAFPAEFSKYVPSDPVAFNDRRYLLVKGSYDDSMVTFEGMYDRPSAYTSQATPAVAQAPSPQASNLKGPTVLMAMNLPSLRSADNSPGVYVAAMGLLPTWPGCDVLLSVDGGATEVLVATITQGAEIGELVVDLVGAGAEPATVVLYGTGQVESVTSAQIAARQNAAALISDDVAEVIQFQTVTEDSSGEFELTDITRGELGTAEVDHFDGDRFVTLAKAVLIPVDVSFAGQTLIFRGVTLGTAAANNPTVSIVYRPLFTGPAVIAFLETEAGAILETEDGAYLQTE